MKLNYISSLEGKKLFEMLYSGVEITYKWSNRSLVQLDFPESQNG